MPTLKWANPTTYVDGSPYGQANNAGYQVSFDSKPPVSLPGVTWATQFDLATLPEFVALKQGSHTASLQCISKGGVASLPGATTFPVEIAPSAPTAVAVV